MGHKFCQSCGMPLTNEILGTNAEKWQDWYINHFPGGPADPNYMLLRFTGAEATLWIDHRFAHVRL